MEYNRVKCSNSGTREGVRRCGGDEFNDYADGIEADNHNLEIEEGSLVSHRIGEDSILFEGDVGGADNSDIRWGTTLRAQCFRGDCPFRVK